jgi:hypothetical protein
MFIPFFLELKAEKITGDAPGVPVADRPGLQAATRELSR